MKVLLLGATGNLGSRLLPALVAHGHEVVVYVRSEQKLKDLVDAKLLSRVTLVSGDATDTTAICNALTTNKCTALVNSAGLAAIFPWQAYRMQDIVEAVASAGVKASEELKYPIRCWFLGGISVLDVPGVNGAQISRYFPLFTEHDRTFRCLSAKPVENLQWSMFCPSVMTPDDQSRKLLEAPRGNHLSVSADAPPNWTDTYFKGVPFFGPLISVLANAARYTTKLEDCADFIAADLARSDSTFVGHRVGVFDAGKGKVE